MSIERARNEQHRQAAADEPIVQGNEPALLLGVNETWNRTTGGQPAEAFNRARQ